jgi:hypothetical protein
MGNDGELILSMVKIIEMEMEHTDETENKEIGYRDTPQIRSGFFNSLV